MMKNQSNSIYKNLIPFISWLSLSLCGASSAAQYVDPIDLSTQHKSSIESSLLVDITKLDSRIVAVGERGHILFSDDNGNNWTQANVSTRAHLNAVFFVSNLQGWAVGEDGVVVHTEDGGANWQLQFDQRNAKQKGPLLDVHFFDDQNGIAIGVFNKIFRTHDGGKTWQNWQENIDNLDEWHLFAMANIGDSHVYIASEMGLVFRSMDKGESFEAIQTDHDGSFHGVLARKGANGEDELLLFGVGGVVLSSLNSGNSWQQLDTGIEDGLSGSTWLENNAAMIVGMNGVQLTVKSNLLQASAKYSKMGYPTSSIVTTSNNKALTVGLAGIKSISTQVKIN